MKHLQNPNHCLLELLSHVGTAPCRMRCRNRLHSALESSTGSSLGAPYTGPWLQLLRPTSPRLCPVNGRGDKLVCSTRALSGSFKTHWYAHFAVASPMLALRSGMPNHDAFAAGSQRAPPNDRICWVRCHLRPGPAHGVVGDHSARHPSAASADAPLSFQTRRTAFLRELCVALSSVHKLPSACLPWAPGRQPGTSLRTGYQSAAARVFVCCRPSAAASSILPEGMAFLEERGRHVVCQSQTGHPSSKHQPT
jgi:hypothetical protein